MDLIPDVQLPLTNDPVGEIVRSSSVMREMTLPVRTRLIAELISKIEELDNQGENTFSRNMMLGIGSTFSMAAAVACTNALAPIAGMCLSIGAVGSWGATMYEVFTENMKIEPVREVLKRLLLALKSAPTEKWAAIWEVAGNDIFVYSLKEASKGHIVRDQLIQLGDERPIDRAIDCIAAFTGQSYEQVTASARAVLAGKSVPSSQPKIIPPRRESFEEAEAINERREQRELPITRIQAQSERSVEGDRREQTTTTIQSEPIPDSTTKDIVELILASVNSLAFIGGQRCGKSLLMAIASRIGWQQGKFKGVFVISSLAKAGEDDHYWQHCATKTFYDLAEIVDKTPYYQYYIDTIRAFKKSANEHNPQLLIIDEYAYLCESLEDDIKDKNPVAIELMQEFAGIGSVVASGGAKRGWYVWVGSPQGNIGDMGRGGRMMKKLYLVFCAIAPGATVDSNGASVTWDDNLQLATSKNWNALQKPHRGVANDLSERIIWMNGRWYAKTTYTLEDVVTPVDQAPTRVAIATEDALTSNERQSLKTAVAVSKSPQDGVLINLLEQSDTDTLDEFIRRDLRSDRIDEVKPRIIAVLKRYGRNDLLQRFSAN